MDTGRLIVVLGVADTRKEDPHLRTGIEFARAHGAQLYVVHGFHLPDPVFYPYPEISALSPEALRQLQEGAQEALQQQVRAAGGDGTVVARAIPGPPELAITTVAKDTGADLIVVGATRRGRIGQVVLGTTAQRVVRASSVPVLVARAGAIDPGRRLLMPTDLSDLSSAALDQGLSLLRRTGVTDPELRFVLVLGYDMTLPPPLSHEALGSAARTELEQYVTRLDGVANATAVVRTGDPAEEIVAEAAEWGADLVVLGTHGRTGISRLLIGSVAESVLRKAQSDVLVVPAAAADARQTEH